jgi:hypothetical protein
MGVLDVAKVAINLFEVPRKERGGAYVRLIFLGLVGWHMFYLEKTARGVLYLLSFTVLMFEWILRIPLVGYFLSLLLNVLGWYGIIPMVQYVGAGALIVFWFFDLFTLWRQVDKWNATHETGNLLMNRVGKAASHAISIPLKNAAAEYKGVVETYQETINEFKVKKSNVEQLLKELRRARGKAFGMVSRMQKILTQITVKGSDVQDDLGDMKNFSAEFDALTRGDSTMFEELEVILDSSTQEMQIAFNAAGQLLQTFEGKAGAVVAAAQTALAAIGEFANQQEEIRKLKQKREEVLIRQTEVETTTMQLEATEKRAAEILKVINAQSEAFNHIYNKFHDNVFPEGFTGKKDIRELAPEQRKMFSDLGYALRKVLDVIKQESRPDAINHPATVKSPPPVHSLEQQPVPNNSAPTGTCKDCVYYNDNWCSWNSASVPEDDAACNHKKDK